MKPEDTGSLVRFRRPDDRQELARLKKLTGLDYETVPVSLVSPAHADNGTGTQGDDDYPDSHPVRPARR